MIRVNRTRRSVSARIRAKLAAVATPAEAEPVPVPEAAAESPPEPLRRELLFGSQYRLRMSFDEVLAARGFGPQGLNLRRRIAETTEAQRKHDAASRRAGWGPGEELLRPIE